MVRKYVSAPETCDPESALMSETAVMRYLGTDSKGILALIKQRRLKRDPLTGSFARDQVRLVHDEILRSLGGGNGAAMGREQQTVGMLDGFRSKPNLV